MWGEIINILKLILMILYLIETKQETENGEWIHVLKIGCTEKLNSRQKPYITSGFSDYQILGKKHGSKMLERMYHVRFRKYAIVRKSTGRRNEWHMYTEDMYNSFFNDTEESLGLFLWKNRKEYLDPYRKQPGKVKKVYEYLKSIYNNSNNTQDNITLQEEMADWCIKECLEFCRSNKALKFLIM